MPATTGPRSRSRPGPCAAHTSRRMYGTVPEPPLYLPPNRLLSPFGSRDRGEPSLSSDHWDISNLIARYAELLNLGRIDEVGELFRYGKITSVGNPTTHTGTDEVAARYRGS